MPRFVGESAVLGPRSRDHQRINASSINHGLAFERNDADPSRLKRGWRASGEWRAGRRKAEEASRSESSRCQSAYPATGSSCRSIQSCHNIRAVKLLNSLKQDCVSCGSVVSIKTIFGGVACAYLTRARADFLDVGLAGCDVAACLVSCVTLPRRTSSKGADILYIAAEIKR